MGGLIGIGYLSFPDNVLSLQHQEIPIHPAIQIYSRFSKSAQTLRTLSQNFGIIFRGANVFMVINRVTHHACYVCGLSVIEEELTNLSHLFVVVMPEVQVVF